MTPFSLVDAHSAAEAVALLHQQAPFAQTIASGGDLLELLKEGVHVGASRQPSVLVNLATAPDLAAVVSDEEGLHIGAMCTLTRLQQVPGLPPLLAQALAHVASPQLRARTTVGGNLLQRPRCLYFRHPDIACFKKGGTGCPAQAGPLEAHPGALLPGPCVAAHPSDLAVVLTALRAKVELLSVDGKRCLPLAALYQAAALNREHEARLAPGEVLISVTLPPPQPGVQAVQAVQAFEKLAPRESNEFAQASAAVVIEVAAGRISSASIVLGGVAQAPHVCTRAEALLVGRCRSTLGAAALAIELVQFGDLPDGLWQRQQLCRLAVERAVVRALTGALQA